MDLEKLIYIDVPCTSSSSPNARTSVCIADIYPKIANPLSFDVGYILLTQAPVHTPSDRSSADPSLDLAQIPRPIGYMLYP